jgi:OmpA family
MILRLLICLFCTIPFTSNGQQKSQLYQIRFEKNKYELSNKNKQVLSLITDTLVGKNNYLIYINGHSDSDADSSYNQQLSLKRSYSVKIFLLEKGIDESLLRVQALGEEQPLFSNTTPLEKAKNRRVELIILYEQKPQEKIVEARKDTNNNVCIGDTTVTLKNGYVLTMSICDWKRNSECLRIEKRLDYKIQVKENWLRRHIGFKKYKKEIYSEPHYQFYVVACTDSCFKNPIKLYIPNYVAPGLKIGERYSQKKNDNGGSTYLIFKKAKLRDSAYFVADISCPATLNCGTTSSGCGHIVNLYAKRKISILSYSYYDKLGYPFADTLVVAEPIKNKKITEKYFNAFFSTIALLYKGDIITLKDIPIEIFAHGRRKIKSIDFEKSYFLFIPYHKKIKCGHYKKYKIRPKDLKDLKQFNILDLSVED